MASALLGGRMTTDDDVGALGRFVSSEPRVYVLREGADIASLCQGAAVVILGAPHGSVDGPVPSGLAARLASAATPPHLDGGSGATARARRVDAGDRESERAPAAGAASWLPNGAWLADVQGAAIFRREGGYWCIVYEGRRVCLRDSKGLRTVAILLNEPNRRFSVRQLVHLVDPPPDLGGGALDRDELRVASGDQPLGPLLDERAKCEYRNRLAALREQLDDAVACNDAYRATCLREEIEVIIAELAKALGLGGRDRPVGADDERARQKVRKNIKAAMDAIAACHPALGRHLARHVKTGRHCWYEPDPDRPTAWTF